ncbi:MAG: efflux RND transporter periplasmic adaptor subunit [Acidobacteria bacterium]|nr:efflux RND transporter periplasmic adaptor subunit [Acidobacteriota bacterium]
MSKHVLKWRRIRLILLVAVVAAILVWAFRPASVPADFAIVERGPLTVTVDEEGETRVRDRYVVSAPLPGRMRRIELEPGDRLQAGKSVLAIFEPADPILLDTRTRAEIEARVRAAEASVGGARAERQRVVADLDFARRELERYRTLAGEGIASRDRLEAAERQVRTLEGTIRSAEFGVRTAEHQLEVARASLVQGRVRPGTLIRLTSPVDGVVLRRLQESEAVVGIGQPLIEIGNLAQLEIVADFLSSAAVRVQAGQPVRVEQWGGDRPLAGRVRRIEPSGFTKISALGVEEQRVNVIVDLEEPREVWQKLGDGYRVEVRVIVWQRDNVVKVPTSSLFRDADRWAVYRVVDGKAQRQIVDVGRQNGLEAEVRSGLEPGQTIIVFPSDEIQDGVAVVRR